jgi:aldose 1-epimerase
MTAPLSPEQITHHTLQQGETQITVLSLGCCVQNWMVGGVPVVLGYSDPADYITNPNFMGAIVGRVANRIGGAEFTLNGETWDLPQNDGVNCLHGGPNGLAHQNWTMAPISDTEVRLSLFSPHGDQGFRTSSKDIASSP